MKEIFSHFPSKAFSVVFLVVISLIAIASWQYIFGLDKAIDWYVLNYTDTQEVGFKPFSLGLFQFEFPAENHLLSKVFTAGPLKIPVNFLYFYLFSLALGLTFIYTAVTYFKRIWFIGFSIGLLFLINLAHLEQVMLFGTESRMPVFVIIGVLLAASYYFHAIKPEATFLIRLLFFGAIFGIIIGVVAWFSEVAQPFLLIAPYAYYVGAILAVVFIVLVSQEVIYMLLSLIGRSGNTLGPNSGRHFLILGTLYLLNLLALYLRNGGHIRVDLALVNEFTILILASVVSFWTLHHKEALLGKLNFSPWGYYFLAGLAIITFGFITSQAALANDPVMDSLEDIISYSHLAFGLMFFVYILLNFIDPLFKNLPVYKIVYKEVNFPFVTSLLGGTVGVAAFFFLAGKVPLFEIKSGYYNLHGDIQYMQNDVMLAEQYYEEGGVYGGNSFKSNYQLATLSEIRQDQADVQYFLNKSVGKHPNAYAYIRLAEYYRQNGDFFNALFTLQTGLKKFPTNAHLRNNIAILYTNSNILDSALIYLDDEFFDSEWDELAEVNRWYVYTKSNLMFGQDTIQGLLNEATDLTEQTNYIGYANSRNHNVDLSNIAIPGDSVLNTFTHSFLNNYALNSDALGFNLEDTLLVLGDILENSDYKTTLDYSSAIAAINNGNFNRAIRNLDLLQGATPRQRGYYLNIAGLVALNKRSYRLASDFFLKSLQEGDLVATLNYGVALCEAGNMEEAIPHWQYVLQNDPDSIKRQVAFNLLYNLGLNKEEVLNHDNPVIKYQYLRYKGNILSEEEFISISNTIPDIVAVEEVMVDQIHKSITRDQIARAKNLFEYLTKGNIQNKELVDNLSVRMAILGGDKEQVLKSFEGVSSSISVNWPIRLMYSRATSDSIQAQEYFDIAMKDPFNQESVIAVARYFEVNKEYQKAYDVLQNSIEVNPYAIRVIKEFCLAALRASLPSYGESGLLQLYGLVDQQEYSTFEARYEDLRRELEGQDAWNF